MASYSTVFPTVENPISEGGTWINGLATGLDFQNLKVSSSGVAQIAAVTAFSNEIDGAVRTGTWTQNQTAEGTIIVNDQGTSQRGQLYVNATYSSNSMTGYALLAFNSVVYIFRCDGGVGNITPIAGPWNVLDGGFVTVTGDKFKITNAGGTLTAYQDIGGGYVALGSTAAPDNTYTTGSPGLGTYCTTNINDIQWSAFSCQDDASGVTTAQMWPATLGLITNTVMIGRRII